MDMIIGDLNTLLAGAVLGGGIAACLLGKPSLAASSEASPSLPAGKM
jgi:hypothetical protein